MVQVEIREQADGSWAIFEKTGTCMGECVDNGVGVQHHPQCGWAFCTSVDTRRDAEKAVADHYATPEGAAVECVDYVFDIAQALLETPHDR